MVHVLSRKKQSAGTRSKRRVCCNLNCHHFILFAVEQFPPVARPDGLPSAFGGNQPLATRGLETAAHRLRTGRTHWTYRLASARPGRRPALLLEIEFGGNGAACAPLATEEPKYP